MKRWLSELELVFYAGMCMFFAVIGTRLKWRSRDMLDKGEQEPFDRRKYVSGLYLAAGAGLVTGLLGQGLHINSSFLMGASIVIGYAGGKSFLDLVLNVFQRYAADGDGEIKKALIKAMQESKDKKEES